MNKPSLIVVTGRPASGKSTLAHLLAKEINYPLIARDELKEGYINTLDIQHDPFDNEAALHIYHSFFEVIDLLMAKNISLIVEAAFQDHLWKPQLLRLGDKAEIRIISCTIELDLAKARFKDRLLANPDRHKFHGDNQHKESGGLQTDAYVPINMDVPTLRVDTTQDYKPEFLQIVEFARRR